MPEAQCDHEHGVRRRSWQENQDSWIETQKQQFVRGDITLDELVFRICAAFEDPAFFGKEREAEQ